MQAACGAGPRALAAADAFRRAGDLIGGKFHRTGFLAGHAGNALILLPMDLHQAETVEPAVDGPQRAEILAERTIYLYGQEEQQKQYPKLPEEKSSNLTAQRFIHSDQGQRSQKGAGGTQVFTEGGDFGKPSEQEAGANAYQQNQNQILSVF